MIRFFVKLLVKGYHPNISVFPECNMTSTWACDYAIDLDSLHQFLGKKWLMPKNATKVRQMPEDHQLQTSK